MLDFLTRNAPSTVNQGVKDAVSSCLLFISLTIRQLQAVRYRHLDLVLISPLCCSSRRALNGPLSQITCFPPYWSFLDGWFGTVSLFISIVQVKQVTVLLRAIEYSISVAICVCHFVSYFSWRVVMGRTLLRLDNKCFSRSLMRRRDSSFFTFGELCRYIRKLCSRSILPKHTPADTDESSLLQLPLDHCRELSCRDFLARLKLKFNLEEASRAKVRKDYSGKKFLNSVLETLAEEIRDNFATQSRRYIVYVFDSLLKDIRLTAGVVRGMASFDLTVLLTQPMEQGLFCFTAIYRSFQLRGWVVESDESEYRGKYVKFIDHLRNTCVSFRDTELITAVVDSFMPMPADLG